MLALLEDVIDVLLNIPAYILLAAEEAINGVISVAESIASAATAILPSLPEVAPPPLVKSINWFFPIGAVISIATPLVAAYVIWLGVKWIYKRVGDV